MARQRERFSIWAIDCNRRVGSLAIERVVGTSYSELEITLPLIILAANRPVVFCCGAHSHVGRRKLPNGHYSPS